MPTSLEALSAYGMPGSGLARRAVQGVEGLRRSQAARQRLEGCSSKPKRTSWNRLKGNARMSSRSSSSIAEGTVKNHVTSILSKLGVSNRTQAALKAREWGLV